MSPTTHNLYVPNIVKTDYQLCDVEFDEKSKTGTLEVFDGKTNKTFFTPNQCESDFELAERIVN